MDPIQLLQTTRECIEQSVKKCDKLGIDISQIKGGRNVHIIKYILYIIDLIHGFGKSSWKSHVDCWCRKLELFASRGETDLHSRDLCNVLYFEQF